MPAAETCILIQPTDTVLVLMTQAAYACHTCDSGPFRADKLTLYMCVCVCVLGAQEAELKRLAKAREQELSYRKEMDGLEVEKQERLAQIENQRFSQMVQSLGRDTLKEIAGAGPELQVPNLYLELVSNSGLNLNSRRSQCDHFSLTPPRSRCSRLWG